MEITRGKIQRAQKVVVYGPEGIGKSTFASKFPEPLFCDTEGGTANLDVARVPKPSSWTMLLETVKSVAADPSLCRTFVLDTADWAERMCMKHVCDKNGKEAVEDFGYGKGYMYHYEEFGKLLNLLNDLIEKGIHVVIVAHAELRKFEQPDEMGAYDRYELKLSKRTGAAVSAMLKEWADMVLFANYKTFVTNVDGQGAAKGKNKAQGGKRVLRASHNPSWDAKNRHGLPDEMDLDFGKIAHLFAEDRGRLSAGAKGKEDTGSFHRSAPRSDEERGGTPGIPESHVPDGDTPKPEEPSKTVPDENIPLDLRELMMKDCVTEQEIMFAVGAKGYYPGDTPIARYDPAFISGVLVAAWPQVRGMVEANRQDVPF